MKTRIVRIGNSQGLRLSRPLLAAAGLAPDAEVEVEAQEGGLVIRPASGARAGWDAAFLRLAGAVDDTPDLATPPTRFDRTEWRW